MNRWKNRDSLQKTKGYINDNKPLYGYQAFRLYFPNEPTSIEATLEFIKACEEYLKKIINPEKYSDIKKTKTVFIDYSAFSELGQNVVSNTEYCLACMGLAMHQIIAKENDTPVRLIKARIINHEPLLQLKNIKVNSYGILVSIHGTVIKASNVQLLCKHISFICNTCDTEQIVNQIDGTYTLPSGCPGKGCKAQTNFEPLLSSINTCTVNWQCIKVQETDQYENGRIPRTVECELTEDLVSSCIPGDDVTITGIIKARNPTEVRQKKNQASLYSLYIDTISIVNNKSNKSEGGITFNINDYYAIQNIHSEPNLFRYLVHSLCPNIFGHELVKAGLLLTLFGGTFKIQGDSTTRSLSHILMVGDPGLGKSQMLLACANVAPRGVYVCGNTTTSCGLTATMTKEPGGNYSLEAGALILADHGCCCIDEFDKMTNQHAALLEAMEQQTISIAKAGVTCNLSACTSVFAAANPAGGHYDKSKTVSENLKMSSPLISRFDLVFILLDRPCEKRDAILSERIMGLYLQQEAKSNTTLDESLVEDKLTLKDRLKLEEGEHTTPLEHSLLRKYIAYAQKYVHPKLSAEAKEILKNFYLELRQQAEIEKTSSITPRQLESALRLTQARAKSELREEATAADAIDVVEIMRYSFMSVFSDESGEMDLTRSRNGGGMSKQKQLKVFLTSLQEIAEDKKQSLFTKQELLDVAEDLGIPKERFFDDLQKLNLHGYLLKKASGKYQLASVDFI